MFPITPLLAFLVVLFNNRETGLDPIYALVQFQETIFDLKTKRFPRSDFLTAILVGRTGWSTTVSSP